MTIFVQSCTVKRWYNQLNHDRWSLTAQSRKGRPNLDMVSENIDAMQKLIMGHSEILRKLRHQFHQHI